MKYQQRETNKKAADVGTRTYGWMKQWEKCIQTREEDKDKSHVMFVLKIDLQWNGIPVLMWKLYTVKLVNRSTQAYVCLCMNSHIYCTGTQVQESPVLLLFVIYIILKITIIRISCKYNYSKKRNDNKWFFIYRLTLFFWTCTIEVLEQVYFTKLSLLENHIRDRWYLHGAAGRYDTYLEQCNVHYDVKQQEHASRLVC